jgi:DNA-binding transcriptional ArsR family regulator
MAKFRFLTNHALVLSHIARSSRITARELSDIIGISERATHNIINDLLEEEFITKKREGRRNRYMFNPDRPISPAGWEDTAAGFLLESIGWRKRGRPRKVSQ